MSGIGMIPAMDNGNKNKKKVLFILLLVAAGVFTILGVFAIVPEIFESVRVRKEIEASVSLARANGEYDYLPSDNAQQNTDSFAGSFPAEETRENVFKEVPDHIADRGIILRGGGYRKSGQSYRATTHDTDLRWYYDYVTDCNLMIDGSDDEFEAFVRRFGDEVGFPGSETGFPAYFSGTVIFEHYPNEDHSITIYRSEYFRWDCMDGEFELPGNTGFSRPIFYDPSGRYIFHMTDYRSEDLLLRFLEPVMTRIEVTRPGQTQPDFATDTINPQVIGLFTDAMHELSATERNEDASTILSSDKVTKISFTAENGLVHHYYFVDGKYLVYNDKVYSVRDCENLNGLLDDGTLFKSEDSVSVRDKHFSSDVDSQLEIIAQDFDRISSVYFGEYDPYPGTSFAVADLNHNGRLEFIITSIQGSGAYSYTFFYEISEDYSTLERLMVNGIDEPDSSGDFLMALDREDPVVLYACYMKDGEYYYLLEDYVSGGWSYKLLLYYSYSFGNGVTRDFIGGCELSAEREDGLTTVNTWLHGPSNIYFESDEAYLEHLENYWSDYEKVDSCEIKWMSYGDDIDVASAVSESYYAFNPDSEVEATITYDYHYFFDSFYGGDGSDEFEYVIQKP